MKTQITLAASIAVIGASNAILAQEGSLDYARPEKNVIKILASDRKKAQTPEEQLKSFKLAEGFIIELVASEKNGVINPIDLTFDDAGRLWSQTAEMYPLDPFGIIRKF